MCLYVYLCTWPTSRVANSWSALNWLHNSAQSLICFQPTSSSQLHLPHVFRRDHLLLGSHHHSGSVQPGSLCVKQFGQASLSACISSLAGIDRVWGLRPAVTCQLELKGTCGYLKVLRGTCGHFLNHVHVCMCVCVCVGHWQRRVQSKGWPTICHLVSIDSNPIIQLFPSQDRKTTRQCWYGLALKKIGLGWIE